MKTVTIVSVCEGNRTAYQFPKDYQSMAIRLAKSIRKNGGALKDSPIVFWYGEDSKPSQVTIDKLTALGCRLVSGKCEVPEDPCSNQFTASAMKFDTDYVLWMDTDMYVNGDLCGIMDSEADVSMAPDTFSIHTWSAPSWDSNWDIFYKHFGVERPNKITSQVDHGQINFYFNNAITLFKNNIVFVFKNVSFHFISLLVNHFTKLVIVYVELYSE